MVNANLQVMEKIKKGKKQTHHITVQDNGEDYDFTVRELTNEEILKLQKVSQKGVKVKVDPRTGQTSTNDIPMENVIDVGYLKAINCIAYSFSLDEENIVTPEQVGELLGMSVIDDLYIKISEINGLEEADVTKNVKKVESFQ